MSRGGWGKTEYTTGRVGLGWVDGIKKSLAIIFQLTFATVRPWQFKKSENINKIVINHFENEKKCGSAMWGGLKSGLRGRAMRTIGRPCRYSAFNCAKGNKGYWLLTSTYTLSYPYSIAFSISG